MSVPTHNHRILRFRVSHPLYPLLKKAMAEMCGRATRSWWLVARGQISIPLDPPFIKGEEKSNGFGFFFPPS